MNMNRGLCETCISFKRLVGESEGQEVVRREDCDHWSAIFNDPLAQDVGTVKECGYYEKVMGAG